MSVIVLEEIEGAQAAWKALHQDEELEQADVERPKQAKLRPKAKGKGKGGQDVNPPSHNARILDRDERAGGRDALLEAYRDDLRIAVSPEMCWAAITGSHARVSRPCVQLPTSGEMTNLDYSL